MVLMKLCCTGSGGGAEAATALTRAQRQIETRTSCSCHPPPPPLHLQSRSAHLLQLPASWRSASLFPPSSLSWSSSSCAVRLASPSLAPLGGARGGRRSLAAHAAVADTPLELHELEGQVKEAPPRADGALVGQVSPTYDASQIQVLEGLEPVRLRPGMYIGSTGIKGLHHLVYEVVDNAIDEAQAGYATLVQVELRRDGSVAVRDDGRGIPTDVHPSTGKSALETVLTVLHAGGKFGGASSGYKVSGGLHGVGVSVVNALSERLDATVWRNGLEYRQSFRQGKSCGEVTERKQQEGSNGQAAGGARTGTQIVFLPDKSIFTTSASLDFSTLAGRLRELAFLNPQVTLEYRQSFRQGKSCGEVTERKQQEGSNGQAAGGARTGTQIVFLPDKSIFTTSASLDFSTLAGRLRELAFLNPQVTLEIREEPKKGGSAAAGSERNVTYRFAGGLEEYVRWLTADKEPLHEPVTVEREADGIAVTASLRWCADSYSDTLLGYANSIRTSDGGTHVEGLKAALTRVLNVSARRTKVVKEKEESLAGEHVREGLTCVLSVKVPNPEFEGQTKTRLGNPGVRKVVDTAVSEALAEYLELHPGVRDAILSKAMQAYKAAEAAKKARELVRRKSVLRTSMLPGKLADCSSADRSQSEIFIVEGDSAGGSAKQGRDRQFQAVLPLRGKILNVERKDDAAIYKNEELQNLILALGLGLKGEEFSPGSLRYSKIIILTDADVDGAHIRTLLLTFLFRYQKALFAHGHVYVGVPPLFKVERGASSEHYFHSEEALQEHLRLLPRGASTSIQRFKGLGEMMPQQLWATTLNPATRTLRQLTVEDVADASRTLSVLMGDKVAPRKELIMSMVPRIALDSLDI
eukprot:TRINITY_DN5283_c0_g2_i1.p1 TRINITY_DN5283_c0_g2~~TRINITY_DN5283_c0_g2_i1.p1  ORF type:complete len:866 (+),score=228.57 TRINITY_DN5283_c0_g2_i1:641-3238(+)